MSAQADTQAAAFNQRLQSDPAFRAQVLPLIQQFWSIPAFLRTGENSPGGQILKQISAVTGLTGDQGKAILSPAGWVWDQNKGQLVRDHSLRNTIIEAAVGLGGSLAGSALVGGFAGGGATAGGTAAGTTAGTTAATTAATTAPSTIATTAGMSPFTKALMSAGVSLGTNVLNGYLQNRAIGKAADQQTAALEKAQAINEQTRKENIARVQPWVNTGLGANSTLANLFGLPSPGGTSGEAPIGPSTPTTPTGPVSPPSSASGGVNPNPPVQPPPGASGGMTLASIGQDTPQAVAQQQTQSGYVRMRAPSGEEQDVASRLVPHYQQLGAVPVGASA